MAIPKTRESLIIFLCGCALALCVSVYRLHLRVNVYLDVCLDVCLNECLDAYV